jgi:hypothetical protein
MTHISFSFHPDRESRYSFRNDDDVVQPALTRETGKRVPVLDQEGNEIGSGIIGSISVHENELSYGAEITVTMEVQFTEPREPRLLWDLAGFSIGSDQATAGKHRNDEEK